MFISNTTGTKEIFIEKNPVTGRTIYKLYSYGTFIAQAILSKSREGLQISCTGLYSATTRRHISDFATLISKAEKIALTYRDFKNSVGREKTIIIY